MMAVKKNDLFRASWVIRTNSCLNRDGEVDRGAIHLRLHLRFRARRRRGAYGKSSVHLPAKVVNDNGTFFTTNGGRVCTRTVAELISGGIFKSGDFFWPNLPKFENRSPQETE